MIATLLAVLFVLAQGQPVVNEDITQWVPNWGQIGAVGVLAWYCWYVTKYTIPRIIGDYNKHIAAREQAHDLYMREREQAYEERLCAHAEAVQRITEDFRNDMKLERESRERMMHTFRCGGLK